MMDFDNDDFADTPDDGPDNDTILAKRAAAYKAVFNSPVGERVLADLSRFCAATESTFEADDPHGRVSAFREGRREVWLRIQGYLNLTEEQMRELNEQ